ncbi:MAG: bifunctional glutamate--cysteine ligase GshA/glutathione synthetase GshB [Bacillaceae bacterium]
MLHHLKMFSGQELKKGIFGAEREMLRVTEDGKLAMTLHPKVFGEKIENPYITTDFSESQIEVITPTFETVEEVYNFLQALYDIVALEIGEEYLWPQSMPCDIPTDGNIPIATFCDCDAGDRARHYREYLFEKYGGKKQLISGIHFNFSFQEEIVEQLYKKVKPNQSYQAFKDAIYLKITRNFLRYRWLLIYLLGSTSAIHESYEQECVENLHAISDASYSNEEATSYRNSECGYKNEVDLFPSYESVESYVASIEEFINEGMIESHRELYSQIRLKAKNQKDYLQSLTSDGIQYVEIRNIDINPFDKGGISLTDLHFVYLFLLYTMVAEEGSLHTWCQEALENQQKVAKLGQNRGLMLTNDGKEVPMVSWAKQLLNEMKEINNTLQLEQAAIIDEMLKRVEDVTYTYSYRMIEAIKQYGYVHAHMNIAKQYKKSAYSHRFKLTGYEDLELSTQILMKESIKRGIKVNVLDRKDNFISLSKDKVTEYVKQATKTSKDNYVTVMMMENKTVTKVILDRHGIIVPAGMEVSSIQQVKDNWWKYEQKPIVIKPKSTNFGLGISIFTTPASLEDVLAAYELASRHDEMVLIEEFIPGKEYRFLVIGDEVVGILHRVPANVRGNGQASIRQLVEEKNKNPLRGKGYKTPLEKIELDENAALFLKQQGKDFDYIPKAEEIVYLRENSNISTGGDSIDYTDVIPFRFKEIAIASARAVGAKICGVDMMINDYQDIHSSYAIIELNFNPAIHIHCYPYKGIERNIGEKVLNLLFNK